MVDLQNRKGYVSLDLGLELDIDVQIHVESYCRRSFFAVRLLDLLVLLGRRHLCDLGVLVSRPFDDLLIRCVRIKGATLLPGRRQRTLSLLLRVPIIGRRQFW